MNQRKSTGWLLAGSFSAVLAALGACSTGSVMVRGSYGPLQERAERLERHSLDLKEGEVLEIDVDSGSVDLRAAATGEHGITANLAVYAGTGEEARRILDQFALKVERTDEGVSVRIEGEPVQIETESMTYSVKPLAELEIATPPNVRLKVKTSTGTISARGPFDSCDLTSGFGNVALSDVRGDVRIQSHSGEVGLTKASGGEISVVTDFGPVTLTDVRGQSIVAESRSGKVEGKSLQAEAMNLRSGFGHLDVVGLQGDLEAHTSSGAITLEDVGEGRLKLQSGFGDIRVEGGRGTLDARSASGRVAVTGFQGEVEAHSGFGVVDLVGSFTALTASSRAGGLMVAAQPTSRVDSGWTLESGYGTVLLKLPADFACQLHAETGFGTIESAFPLQIDAGAISGKRVKGAIGAGGGEISLKTSSGNIKVIRSETAPKS